MACFFTHEQVPYFRSLALFELEGVLPEGAEGLVIVGFSVYL